MANIATHSKAVITRALKLSRPNPMHGADWRTWRLTVWNVAATICGYRRDLMNRFFARCDWSKDGGYTAGDELEAKI